MTSASARRWWRVFGPWPIRPGLLTVAAAMFYLVFRAGAQGSVVLLAPVSLRQTILPGLVAAPVIYLVAWLGRAWQRGHDVRWPSYLLTHVAIAAAAMALRTAGVVDIRIEGTLPNVVVFSRLVVLFLLTSTIAGSVVNRLEQQITATQEALDLARRQQQQLISADEDVRRQVSLLLHDRVQAGLLATCLELRAFARLVPDSESGDFESLIRRLEDLRAVDLRTAARALSPNLEEVDLQTALEDLAAPFDGTFVTRVHVAESIDRDGLSAPTALAAYRIVEQAILNVAAHAHATTVIVDVAKTPTHCQVRVRDNGVGLPADPKRGLGSTIIAAWVASTPGGSWTIENSIGGGAVLAAGLGSTSASR